MRTQPNAIALTVVLIVSLFSFSLVLAAPEAPDTITDNGDSRRTQGAIGYTMEGVFAGNVTHLTITGVSVTQGWAGFYGNITGVITLDDSLNRTLYDWNVSDPEGEVFATTASTVNWSGNGTGGQYIAGSLPGSEASNLRCFSEFVVETEDVNLSELETTFGMASDDVDGIDETFNTATHDPIFVGSVNFSANSCLTTSTYTADEERNNNLFQELILYDDTNNAVIWTTLIENNVTSGFTGGDTDWQLLVPEDGNGTDTSATTYYFYVELE